VLCHSREATKSAVAKGGELDGYSRGIGQNDSADDFSSKEHSVKTWRGADFFICFPWESQSTLFHLFPSNIYLMIDGKWNKDTLLRSGIKR
jgi:hypothetical protein